MKVSQLIGVLVCAAMIAGISVMALHAQNAPAQGVMVQADPAAAQDAAADSEVAALAEPLEVTIGFRIAPVRLTFTRNNRELVGLGSYIVNGQGACNDCHTNPPFEPGHDPFRGERTRINVAHYLAGGMTFGPFTSRNITPAANGKPGGLSFAQFLRVMRFGEDFDHAHPQISPLLQVMPWPVYRHMRLHHLRAIYMYLSAIPHATPGP